MNRFEGSRFIAQDYLKERRYPRQRHTDCKSRDGGLREARCGLVLIYEPGVQSENDAKTEQNYYTTRRPIAFVLADKQRSIAPDGNGPDRGSCHGLGESNGTHSRIGVASGLPIRERRSSTHIPPNKAAVPNSMEGHKVPRATSSGPSVIKLSNPTSSKERGEDRVRIERSLGPPASAVCAGPTANSYLQIRCNVVTMLFAGISYPPIPIFELGPLQLSLHGLMAAVGFFVGSQYTVKHAGKRGFDEEAFQSIFMWALVGAMLGARYFTVPAQIAEGASLVDALKPLGGNFSIMGGFAGGMLAGLIQIRRLKQLALPLFDSLSFGLVIGTILGRWGDVFIVEHLGRSTDSVFGYTVKSGYELAPQHRVLECAPVDGLQVVCGTYHHTGAYDMIWSALLWVVLIAVAKRMTNRKYGQLFALWVFWYGLGRFFIDFYRQVPTSQGEAAVNAADSVLGAFTWSQWSGLGASVLALVLWFAFGQRQKLVTELTDAKLAEAANAKLNMLWKPTMADSEEE